MKHLSNGLFKLCDNFCAFVVNRIFNCRHYLPEASTEHLEALSGIKLSLGGQGSSDQRTKESPSRIDLSISSLRVESKMQKITRDFGFGVEANQSFKGELRTTE